MPHIRIRGISEMQAKDLNTPMIDELVEITGTPVDHFIYELVAGKFFSNGRTVSPPPYIEVLWFDRDKAMQDACAEAITKRIKAAVPDQDVTVVFTKLEKSAYYENGKHF